MNDPARLIRLSGVALVLAGLLYLPQLLDGWRSVIDVGSGRWRLVTTAETVHHLIMLFGLVGLLAAQLRRGGALGTIAFVVASLGHAVVAGIRLVEVTVLPALAANPAADAALICTPFFPPATRSGQTFTELACSDWGFGALAGWTGAGTATLIGGSLLLGLAIARAGVLPPAAGITLSAGWLLELVGQFVPLPVALENVAYLAIAGAYIWCGAILFARFPAAGALRPPRP